jgi:chromate reductase
MARRLAPADLVIEPDVDLTALPFYNLDLDQPGSEPAAVLAFRQLVAEVDAVLIVSPEYTWSTPAVLKNALEWATRPFGQHVLAGKVTAVMTSSSKGGGAKMLAYLEEMLGLLGNSVVAEPVVALKLGADYVMPDGTTTDPSVEVAVRGRLDAMSAALQCR